MNRLQFGEMLSLKITNPNFSTPIAQASRTMEVRQALLKNGKNGEVYVVTSNPDLLKQAGLEDKFILRRTDGSCLSKLKSTPPDILLTQEHTQLADTYRRLESVDADMAKSYADGLSKKPDIQEIKTYADNSLRFQRTFDKTKGLGDRAVIS